LELRVRLHRAGLAEHLAALDFLALGAAQQATDVVASLALIEQLAEHFDAGDNGLGRRLNANDLDFLTDLDDAALDSTGTDGATAGDGEHVLDRHQERLILRALRLRDVFIDRLHERHDRFFAELLVAAVERLERRTLDDRDLVAREIVLREKLANLELDQLEQFRIVDHIDFIHVDNQRRNAD